MLRGPVGTKYIEIYCCNEFQRSEFLSHFVCRRQTYFHESLLRNSSNFVSEADIFLYTANHIYSTVTDFAKLRGWSISHPKFLATK